MADINLGVGGANSATGGFSIDNSLKLEANNSEYLHFTPSSQTDYERMAFSIWIKRTELSTTQTIAEFGNGTSNTTNLRIGFDTSDRLFIYANSIVWRESTRVFRDTSAWYHLFFLFDTTTPGGVSNNRIRVWVNGSMIEHTDYGTINNPSAGSAMGFNNSIQQSLGAQREDGPKNYFCGYIAQAWGSGGTPPVVGDFGEYDDDSGIWKPIDISSLSIPDNNGFFLDFSDSSDLGNDSSSNNNDFTLVNIAAADQATDTPTNNFPVLNPLWNAYNEVSRFTITEGGTAVTGNQSQTLWRGVPATIPVNSGKWYWEVEQGVSVNGIMVGYGSIEDGTGYSVGWRELTTISSDGGAKMMYSYNMDVYGYNSSDDAWQFGGGNFNTAGDIISIALDLDNGYAYFRKNGGSWFGSGDPSSGSSGTGAISVPWNSDGRFTVPVVTVPNNTQDCRVNFGGYTKTSISSGNADANGYGNFEYAVPSGYYAICTKNIAQYG